MENRGGGDLGQRLTRRDLLESTGIMGAAMMIPNAKAAEQGASPERAPAGLRISSVKATVHNVPVHVPLLEKTVKENIVFVEVTTDEGVTGYGLTGDLQRFGVREFINRQLAPFLKGKNALGDGGKVAGDVLKVQPTVPDRGLELGGERRGHRSMGHQR